MLQAISTARGCQRLDDVTLMAVLWKCCVLGRMDRGMGAGRLRHEWVKWVHVPYTYPEMKQTNVIVTMATRHILRIFEIS